MEIVVKKKVLAESILLNFAKDELRQLNEEKADSIANLMGNVGAAGDSINLVIPFQSGAEEKLEVDRLNGTTQIFIFILFLKFDYIYFSNFV